ncbi:hypothetical protein GON01_08395, partial [Sphingomonas sp. MAH-20]|nr:hypothetical protein [Sphingomonas sp. CGMCC 1.13658]MVO77951.1 hypothetical protein [Sphingomonas horti]
MAQYQARGAQLQFSAAGVQGGQGLARVVGLRDGGFSVTWIGADSDRTMFDGDMFAQVFDSNLAPVSPNPLQLITDTGPSNSYPVNYATTTLQNGGFAVFSTDNANYNAVDAANNRDVALRLYDGSGGVVGQPLYIGASTILGVTVTTLADGRLVAGWLDNGGVLRAHYVSAQGDLVGSTLTLDTPASNLLARPDFSSLADGGWVATYVVQGENTARAIFFDAQGHASPSQVIATNLTNIEGVQTYQLADDRVIFVWAEQAPAQQLEIHGQIYSANGSAFGSEFTLSTVASSVTSVTGLADGGFAVALEPAAAGPLEVKVFDSIGRQNGATLTFNDALEPSISTLADGGFVTVWKDANTDQFHAQAFQAIAAGDLMLTGDGSGNVVVGQEGNDTLQGLGGADQLYGSVGNDHLYGGDGDDVLDGGSGFDILDGGAGVDRTSGGLG